MSHETRASQPLSLPPRRRLLLRYGVDQDPRRDIRRVARAARAPVVADGVGEQAAIAAKPGGRDSAGASGGGSCRRGRRRGLMIPVVAMPAEPAPRHAVPEVEAPVRAGRHAHRRLRGVELHVVDGPDLRVLGRGVGRVAVALECEGGWRGAITQWAGGKREKKRSDPNGFQASMCMDRMRVR